MAHPTQTAIGTWSGGRFMHFGEPVEDDRLVALLRPDPISAGAGIHTVMTADAYGAGDADRLLGSTLKGLAREEYVLVGAVGHDFYEGEREGAKGFPRFTDPRLRGPEAYADYLRHATEASLERCGVDRFDLLLLHNPDKTGYQSEAVWDGMAALRDAGLTDLIGVAPGPANGYTLDLIDCFERFGDRIDWAMVILNPLEPWPGELALPAAARHDVQLITRVVDYGGLFGGDLRDVDTLREHDHRRFRPAGWVERGLARMERMQAIGARHGLTPLQLACQWNLAHEQVRCVAPTLLQEAGPEAVPVERKREELAALPSEVVLSADEVEQLREIGDNTGSMALKGAATAHEGPALADRWSIDAPLLELAARWEIDPATDLAQR
ncbi:MAG TPA: aldo/keto reductase [Conexibacter sp.]|jgi:aryl-alcohol dehydrogenase-like predicted oxidoreductase